MMPSNPPCTVTTVGFCGEPGVALVDFGCVHEHLEIAVPVCSRHLDRREVLYCQTCLELGHPCVMRAGPVCDLAG